jgi:hypothetical protein
LNQKFAPKIPVYSAFDIIVYIHIQHALYEYIHSDAICRFTTNVVKGFYQSRVNMEKHSEVSPLACKDGEAMTREETALLNGP